ncbi:MAG: PQQ-binding-like beta-propeller repeat protein [Acidobacteriota bacterium]
MCACAGALLAGGVRPVPSGYREWKVYGGGAESIRYSALNRINRTNASRLRVAWTFDTGDAFAGSEMQCNPVVAGGVLYATTPKLRVVALDARTGRLRWAFDPNEGVKAQSKVRNRGLTYWEQGNRLYVAVRQWLYSLDAATGRPVPSFGRDGRIDLRDGLGRDPALLSVSASTPGIIYRDLLILGSIVPEDLPSAPGDLRAYDLRTGKIRWTFHTIPRPGEYGYETWPKDAWKYIGGANNWSGMSLDEKRGLVFASTGSPAFDFWGGNRAGDNLFANCVLALDAATGRRVWHFQGVHHDVWDRDFPAPPSLVTVARNGRLIDAVAQITKSGWVWVLDRETGKPLFPFEERPVPPSDMEGESLAKTQPFPLAPPPFTRQEFTEAIVTKRTPEARRAVLENLKKVRSGKAFLPPSRQGSIIYPGLDGGGEWGGAAFDPETGLLYVNANEMVWTLRLLERKPLGGRATGRDLYVQNCAACHREDLRGSPPEFPALAHVANRYTQDEVAELIVKGAPRMPAFGNLPADAVGAIARYLITGKDTDSVAGPVSPYPFGLKFRLDGYTRFTDPDGYPAVEPPWGTLTAINLDKGSIAWQVPLGEFPELAAKGLRNTGSENYGGPLVTAGGVIFIGATNYDKKFRVFDKANGKLLWETLLPAAGNATPSTYEVDGRQYVVIACGGGKWGAPSGGSYVAFTLAE